MTDNEYLNEVLKSQNLDPDGPELKALEEHRKTVEAILREKFGSSPTIRYAGSKAKGTLIKENYDLDIINYFPHEDTSAGETLKEIYENVRDTLSSDYYVEPKGSALRLKDRNPQNYKVDFHIDVVPGRFVDDEKSDTFLYRSSGEKERLKTNLDVHIAHVKKSGVIDAIRLMKLWSFRNHITLRNFILELLVIELLKEKKNSSLADQLKHVWTEFKDHYKSLHVEDPANPAGNDLSDALDDNARQILSQIAASTLQQLDNSGWEAVFGAIDKSNDKDKINGLVSIASTTRTPTKPWSL